MIAMITVTPISSVNFVSHRQKAATVMGLSSEPIIMSGMQRRKSSQITISLFSFQDIVTCLSGIMILLVLIITVDLATGKLAGKNGERALSDVKKDSEINSPNIDDRSLSGSDISVKREIELLKKKLSQSQQSLSGHQIRQEELREQLRALEQKREALSRQAKSISFIPAKDDGQNHRPLLIECSRKSIRSAMIDQKGALHIFSTDQKGMGELIESIQKLNRPEEYPLFIIKPSASDYAMQLIEHVQNMGFDVGYDAIAEEESLALGENHQ